MRTTLPRADLLLSRRGDRIADELDRAATDGWLVYDFRGSNPAFSRLLAAGAGTGTELEKILVLQGETGTEGVLHITAQAASCADDPANEHPACHVARQDWGVPVRLAAAGETELALMLLG
jgi:hypothetical protein